MTTEKLTLVAVGDVAPNRDDPPSIFRHCGQLFRTADIVFGQLESPVSDRGTAMFKPDSPCKIAAKNITAFAEDGAGFDIVSFAGNHAMDYGYDAFFDTLDALDRNNIAMAGAGKNIGEARKPVILTRNGTSVGFLAYVSVVYPGLVAEEDIPGCAPLRSSHFYQQVDFQPGSPPLIVTNLLPDDKTAMKDDIERLRPRVDVLVVSMHCGVLYLPAVIAMYQKEAAHAAIDAGADLVLQHHAHILRGIEIYRGKATFYGLGNFGIEHALPFPGKAKAWDPAWRSMRKFYRIKPAPGWERYPYHPDARMTLVAKAYVQDRKIERIGYMPAYINPNAEPEVLTRTDTKAQEVFDYVRQISDSEELKVDFAWDGDEVMIT